MSNFLRKIEVTSGGYLLLAMLVFMLDTEVLLILFGNVCIHELGHLWMLSRCGAYVRKVSITGTGLCIRCNTYYLTPIRMVLCAGAGPAAGLAAAAAASCMGHCFSNASFFLFAGVGVVLSLFNLLPAKPLDGWQMLNAAAPALAHTVSVLTSILSLLFGVTLMYMGHGTVFALMGIFLLLQNEGGKHQPVFG